MSQQLRAYFDKRKAQENAKKFPLPNELVLWEGRSKYFTHAAAAMLLLLIFSVLALLVAAFVFMDEASRSYVIFIIIAALVIYGIAVAAVYLAINKRYILTSERLIIQTINGSRKAAVNCKFSQILELSLKNKFGISYIEFITPYMDIPSRLYPSKNLQEFYEALSLLCQFGNKPEEKARLQRLYYPPWKPWILYSLAIGLVGIVYITLNRLPLIVKFGSPWDGILPGAAFLFVLVTMFGRIFAPLFMGKDFKYNTRVSTKHIWIQICIILLITFIPIFIFSPR